MNVRVRKRERLPDMKVAEARDAKWALSFVQKQQEPIGLF